MPCARPCPPPSSRHPEPTSGSAAALRGGRVLVWVLALGQLCASRGRADGSPPTPEGSASGTVETSAVSSAGLGSPGSHTAFLEDLAARHGADYRAVVARYDAHLAEHPDDALAAIERCRFLDAAADGGEYGDPAFAGAPAEAERCPGELLTRYPSDGEVRVYHLARLYGESAIAFADETSALPIAWEPGSLARYRAHLAWANFQSDRTAEAAALAELVAESGEAVEPYEEVTPILATHYRDAGQRERALAVLEAAPGTAHGYQRVQLLLELRAFSQALALVERLKEADIPVSADLHAQALEGVGDAASARALYDEMAGTAFNQGRARERIFQLELAGGDSGRALRAYEALRDEGFDADPFARRRLALTAAWPGSRWQPRDLLGLLGLLGLALVWALLPALWIVPIHYAGLLRPREPAAVSPCHARWTVRHLWLVSWALLLPELGAAYVFVPQELEAWLEDVSVLQRYDRAALAGYALTAVGLGLLLVLAMLRRGDVARLLRSTWSTGETLGFVCVTLLGLGLINRLFVPLLGEDVFDGHYGVLAASVPTSLPTVEFTTLEALRSVALIHGGSALLVVIAVVVPFLEEVAFRGIFLGAATRYIPFGWANALQAGLFTLAHDRVEHFPALLALGLVAGLVTRRAGGLAPAIALHGTMNLLAGLAIMLGLG